ncbi:C6 finger domain-containing protein [Paecilomyces variotii No. 5]|uniref:C6 finger domain-containing protein n=1 Tax=Byssochlamys spectabilis (strain No. 5 / NBRC 109023) TaxID=1356009 RepID=V5FNW2_BYSSN|nr:C6 finger domain-containing protein [Paecilomyces variotii No. 5]
MYPMSETESKGGQACEGLIFAMTLDSQLIGDCDRTKPCRACCSKGTPEACQYNTNSEDRFYISQAEIIDRLRNEVNNLRKKLAILEDDTESDFSVTESESDSASSENPMVIQVAVRGSSARRTGTKYTALERMYTLLASAPLNLVEDAVIQIRGGASVEAVEARVTSVDYAIIRGHSV